MSSETPPSLPPRPSSNSVIPPPLPERARSEAALDAPPLAKEKKNKSSSNVNNGHYAHLDKHLKEVRRRKKTSKVTAPVLSNFKKQDSSTDWINYINAVT